jgi:hypothetical protein
MRAVKLPDSLRVVDKFKKNLKSESLIALFKARVFRVLPGCMTSFQTSVLLVAWTSPRLNYFFLEYFNTHDL